MTNMNEELAKRIEHEALDCGYERCGIVPLTALAGYGERLHERIRAVPESAGFYGRLEAFTLDRLREAFPWARSVVVCAEWYGKYRYPETLQGVFAKAFALSPSGHPDSEEHRKARAFEDRLDAQGIIWAGGEANAPAGIFPLRWAAVAAGLGIFRNNNFFYTEKGSYYNLRGYLIDQDCELIRTPTLRPCPDKCDRCRRACPTCSLSAAHTMNPLSCVSRLTTFGSGGPPEGLDASCLQGWVCGCDACQDACPFNRGQDWSAGVDFPGLADAADFLQPQSLLEATDQALCERALPWTDAHIAPDRVEVLRVSAQRVLARAAGA